MKRLGITGGALQYGLTATNARQPNTHEPGCRRHPSQVEHGSTRLSATEASAYTGAPNSTSTGVGVLTIALRCSRPLWPMRNTVMESVFSFAA